jgi:hypothetical protein
MEHIDQNILWAYIIDDIEPKNIEIIKHHLDVCPTCKHEYDVQVKLHNELYEINEDMPSLDFSTTIISKIERSLQIEKANQFWLKFAKTAIISAIIIAVILPMIVLITQRVEFTISNDYLHKIIFPLSSICLILWAFYGMDVFLRRTYVK